MLDLFNNPEVAEFYPRRIYTIGGCNFCIVNNAAAPAYRDWDASKGIDHLMEMIRKWHQPDGNGTDEQIRDVAGRIIEMAMNKGHLKPTGKTWIKLA